MIKLEEYIVTIKKTMIGGFDRKSVYEIIKEIFTDYQKDMEQLKDKLELTQKKLDDTTYELTETKKNLLLKSSQLEEEKIQQNDYKHGLTSLIQAVDVVNMSKENVIREAEAEAERIINEANKKYENARYECLLQKQKTEEAHSAMVAEEKEFEISMGNLRSGLEDILNRIDKLQNKHDGKLMQSACIK